MTTPSPGGGQSKSLSIFFASLDGGPIRARLRPIVNERIMPPRTAKRRDGHPDGALHIATYARLEEYLRAFASGHLNLVILVGPAGMAKSRTVRSVLGSDVCWIEGNATPFGMYEELY